MLLIALGAVLCIGLVVGIVLVAVSLERRKEWEAPMIDPRDFSLGTPCP
jgi:hypothetical protein